MTVRDVGGCLIDLTRRDRQSDQLSAFYPGAQLRDLKFAGIEVEAPKIYEAAELDRVFVQARRVTLRLVAAPREKEPDVEVCLHPRGRLALRAGDNHFLEPRHRAGRRRAARRDPRRSTRSSRAPRTPADLFWAYDKHFGQAYGVVADGHEILGANARRAAAPLSATATARSPSGSRPARRTA